MDIGGKTADGFWASFKGQSYDGYVLSGIGIGGGDYVEFKYCLDCGQIQGDFPISSDPTTNEEWNG